MAEHASVRALDGLLAVAEARALGRPCRLDAAEFALAVAASGDLLGLLNVLVD